MFVTPRRPGRAEKATAGWCRARARALMASDHPCRCRAWWGAEARGTTAARTAAAAASSAPAACGSFS